MSEEQFSALLAKLKQDAGLQEKLKGAVNVDAAVGMAKEAGFNVSADDLFRHQAKQNLELSDAELEEAVGGKRTKHDNTTECFGDWTQGYQLSICWMCFD